MSQIDPTIGAGIIGSAGNLGASIVGAVSANKMQKRQFEQQKQLYEQQFKDQRQLIAEQNAYNSPANQRKLLEEAGLNPMLMYQNGTSQSIQSEVANPQVPDAPRYAGAGEIIAGGVQKGIDTMMSMAQLRLLEAQARKTDAEATGQDISNRYSPAQYDQQLRKGEVDIDYTIQLTDKVIQDINESGSRIDLNKAQIDSLTQGIAESKIRATKILYETKGIEMSTELARQKIATEMLEQGMYAFRVALVKAQTREASANAANIHSKTFEQDWKNAFIEDYGVSPDASKEQMIFQLVLAATMAAAEQSRTNTLPKYVDTDKSFKENFAAFNRNLSENAYLYQK